MAGEMVASALVDLVLEKLVSGALKEFGLLCGIKEDLNKLESKLSEIKAVLEVAEKQVVVDKALRDWLLKLKYAAYDADDLLVEFHMEAERHKLQIRAQMTRRVLQFFSYSNPVIFRLKIAHKIKGVRTRIDAIAAEKDQFPLNIFNIQNTDMEIPNRETCSAIEESAVYGRDKDRETIISLLLNTSTTEKISIIAIVGMGGLGKTTLAQLIINDERVKGKYSDLQMWVYVSRNFDLNNICRLVIEESTKRTCDLKARETLYSQLKEELSNKRFLLVLDDLWNTDERDLDELKLFFSNGREGSKIIVTTRNMEVPRIMRTSTSSIHQLKGLSDDDCWALFKKRAFASGDEDEDPFLVAIGKEIVDKCGGVPLAVNTLASMLYLKGRDFWAAIRDSDIWKQSENGGDRVLTSLRLTYANLPSRLKQCFAYCSIFPKGYEIDRDLLIAQWTAQGFISSSSWGLQVEETGKEYFNKLKWVSFLQEEFEFRGRVACKMHDLVHDLAQSIAGDEVSIIHEVNIVLTKHCRYACSLVDFYEIPHTDIRGKLRALHLRTTKEQSFSRFKCLRSLSISCSLFSSSISKLHNLKYLEVSGLRSALPESIRGLGNLQTLCLIDCENSNPLPESVGNLKSVSSLDLRKCQSLEKLPESIGGLTSLKSLILSRCKKLQELPQSICGLRSLDILYLDSCEELRELPQSIGGLTSLKSLDLSLCKKLQELPQSICGLRSLDSLDLESCEELRELPASLGSVTSLRHLDIQFCNRIMGMPPQMGQLTKLETLSNFVVGKPSVTSSIQYSNIAELEHLRLLEGELSIDRLENVGSPSDAGRANLQGKQKLRSLTLSWRDAADSEEGDAADSEEAVMQSLEPPQSIERLDLFRYRGASLPEWICDLASLKRLWIFDCCRLSALPEGLKGLTRLEKLVINGASRSLADRCEREQGEDWHKIAHIPDREITT